MLNKDEWLLMWHYTPGTPEAEALWEEKLRMMQQSNASHMVIADIQPYQSMATGEYITSRSKHREHLKKHGLIEVGNETKHLKPKEKQLPPGLKDTIIRLAHEKLH